MLMALECREDRSNANRLDCLVAGEVGTTTPYADFFHVRRIFLDDPFHSQRSLPFPHLVFVGPMKVEGQVMGSSSENILKQSFGGVYSNELLAEGGSLYSERPEPFSYISVEVGVL